MKILTVFISALMTFSVNADIANQAIGSWMKEKSIPGVQITVVKNGQLVNDSSFGIANLQHGLEINPQTVFNLASITKAYTSVAIVQQAEAGKLDLELGIGHYLEDVPDSWKGITLRQLLSHTSGLPNVMNHRFQLIDSRGEKESWEKLKLTPLKFTVGEKTDYNQTNYLLVGKIVEKALGKSYDQLIDENQLVPLGLTRTREAGFSHFHEVISGAARNYRFNDKGHLNNVLTYFPSFIRSGAGMSSTSKELALWAEALKNNKLLKEISSTNTIFTAVSGTRDKNNNMHPYGLGWYFVDHPSHPRWVSAGGGQSAVVIYPKDNLTIALLTNLAGAKPEYFIPELVGFYIESFDLDDEQIALKNTLLGSPQKIAPAQWSHLEPQQIYALSRQLAKEGHPQAAVGANRLNNQLNAKYTHTGQSLDLLVGNYKLPNFDIQVTRENNYLFIKATGDQRLPIFALSPNSFEIMGVEGSITFSYQNNQRELQLKLSGQTFRGNKVP